MSRRNDSSEHTAAEAFAASEIASAIGWGKRRVQAAIGDAHPTRLKRVAGQVSGAWSIAAMPAEIREPLEGIRARHHYRTIEDVLRAPRRPWELVIDANPVPLAHVAENAIGDARRLQEALSRALSLPSGELIAERVRLAADDFLKVFGRTVGERHLRRLIERTMERDRGAGRFDRLEIYLEESRSTLAKDTVRDAALIVSDFPELADSFALVANPQKPTASETAFCWRKIVETIADRAAAGADEKQLKRELRDFVVKAAPFLADSHGAFKRNLNRKLSTANEQGITALIDARAERSGHRRKPDDWDQNILLLARHAGACERVAQAFRHLYAGVVRSGERFTESFRAFFDYDPRRNKSRVPDSVMAAVRPMLTAAAPYLHGPKTARLAAPSIRRDWSSMPAGASYSGDDFTLNHPFVDWCDGGEYEFNGRRFNVTRGQALIFCDERSRLILGYKVVPRPFYVANDICTAIAELCMDPAIGLPFSRFYFERGIWRGNKVRGLINWSALDEAFTRQGSSLKMAHATTPRAKVIERIGGMIQSIMQPAPGYVGRNERLDVRERVQHFLASLKRAGQPIKAEVNPEGMLMTQAEFCAELDRCIALYNSEPQSGENMASRSPGEVWAEESGDRAHVVLPDSLRYLLSTNHTDQTVTSNGVKVSIAGGERFYSDSAQLGALRGEKVRVRFNPELPDLVMVCHLASDPRELNPFAVGPGPAMPVWNATREQLAECDRKRKTFTQYGRGVFRAIAPRRNLTVRNESLGTEELRERGNRIAELENEHVAHAKRRGMHRGEIQQLAASQNLQIDTARVRDPERVAANLRRAAELEEKIKQREANATESN